MLQRYDFLVIIMQDVFEILNYLQNNPKFLIVAKWHSGIVAKWQSGKLNPQPLWKIADAVRD